MAKMERIVCPACGRAISAFVPSGGDGTGLRPVRHCVDRRRSVICRASYAVLVRRDGEWEFDK